MGARAAVFRGSILYVECAAGGRTEFSLALVWRRRLVICISIFGFACRVDIAMVNYFIIPSVLAGGAAAIGSPGCVSRLLPPRAVFSKERERESTPAKERERELCACGALDIRPSCCMQSLRA